MSIDLCFGLGYTGNVIGKGREFLDELFWDARFAESGNAYGTEPNDFPRAVLPKKFAPPARGAVYDVVG